MVLPLPAIFQWLEKNREGNYTPKGGKSTEINGSGFMFSRQPKANAYVWLSSAAGELHSNLPTQVQKKTADLNHRRLTSQSIRRITLTYDPSLMAELIKKLSESQKKVADAQGERDFHLRCIAQLSGAFGSQVPEIIDDTYRRNILALVSKISGNQQNTIVQMPVTNGKGGR